MSQAPQKRKRTVEGSCWPCKDRRLLCDLKKPSCSRCVSTQQFCQYGKTRLRWINGVASRGKLAGQNLITKSITPAMTVDRLMLYFEHNVVPRFNLANEPLPVDLSSINKDDNLKQSVAAVAYAHYVLYSRSDSPDIVRDKNKTRLSAIEVFRQQLLPEGPSKASAQSVFIANVLLCVLDGIIEPEDLTANSYCHFLGGKAILNKWHFPRNHLQIKQGLPALTLSIFGTIDLCQALLSGDDIYFEHTWWPTTAESDCWWGCLASPDDPFLQVMSLIARLARLGHHHRQADTEANIDELLAIQQSLEHQEVQLGLPSPPEDSSSIPAQDPLADEHHGWDVFTSAYISTAFIYMYRALCNLPVDHELVQRAMQNGLDAICSHELTGNLAHCLLFPTLIIGSHCIEATQRKDLMAALSPTASYLSFGSIRIMADFLQDVWKDPNMNLTWWDRFEDIAKKTFLF